MYEEDRQTALAMYNQLFDEVDDEQGLLQLLVSPTRQAVVIARSYNAKERKLQVHAQSREESDTASDGAAPEFMGVIESIREEALSRQAPKTAEVSADQFSMFEDDFFAPTPETPAAPAEAEPEAPAEEAPAAEAEAPAVEVEAAAEAPAETAEPATDEPVDEVDAFIADFSIPADQQEFAPEAGEQTAPAEPAEPAQPEEAEAPAESDEDDSAPIVIEEEDDEEYDDEYYDAEEYAAVPGAGRTYHHGRRHGGHVRVRQRHCGVCGYHGHNRHGVYPAGAGTAGAVDSGMACRRRDGGACQRADPSRRQVVLQGGRSLMKNAWRIIIMVVLVAILLGGVGIAVGMMTGADFTRIYSVLDERYNITLYYDYLPELISQVEAIYLG